MIWLLANWKLLAVALLLASSNLITYRYVHNAWDAEKARASVAAERAARNLEAYNAARANAQAESTRDMETTHNAEIEAIRAGGAVAERSYADSLRTLTNRLGQCKSTSEALGAIVASDGARSREDRLSEEVGRDFAEVGRRANELAATVKLCVAWANSIGR